MPVPPRTGLLFPASALALVLGCGMGLPLEERIASTRPLAVRVEIDDPTAPMDAAVKAEGLPLDRVRLVPFFVDAEDPLTLDEVAGTLEPVWLQCVLQPLEGLSACIANAAPLAIEDVPDCPAVDFGAFDPSTGSFPELPSPCRVTEGTPAQPELTIPFDVSFLLGGDLELTMVGHEPGRGDTQRCLEVLLSGGGTLDEGCIFVSQRVAVGPDAELLQLASMLGLPDLEQLGTIPDEIPEPDTHPTIQSFVVKVFGPDDEERGTFMPQRGEVIEARVDDRIELETITPEGDLQTYLIARDMTAFDERQESLDGRWFRSWGTLLSSVSDDPFSINTWTLTRGEQDDDETPPGDRATLYYVLRDDRQGVDWWWFHVDIVP